MIFITSPGNIVQTHLGYITLSHYHRYHTLSGRQGFIIKTDRSKHLFLINIRILSYHIWTARIMTIMTIIGYPAQSHNILIKLILHLSFKSGMSGVWLVCQYYSTTAHISSHQTNYSCSDFVICFLAAAGSTVTTTVSPDISPSYKVTIQTLTGPGTGRGSELKNDCQ